MTSGTSLSSSVYCFFSARTSTTRGNGEERRRTPWGPPGARIKNFAMDLLHRSARSWPAEFRTGVGVGVMLDTVDAEFAKATTGDDDKPSASYLVPLQQCIFRFLCKAFVGADPSADWLLDNLGFTILDIWLALQILPTQKVGVVQPLEEAWRRRAEEPWPRRCLARRSLLATARGA